MKLKIYIFIYCTVTLLFIYFINIATAFDDKSTHPELTKKAVDSSKIKSGYLKETLGDIFSKGIESVLADRSVLSWIQKGAADEDTPSCRASSHFHNPISNSGLTDFLEENNLWALEVRGYFLMYCLTTAPRYIPWTSTLNWATASADNEWGWQRTRNSYYLALTFSTKQERENYFASTFYGLGSILHLLQDMAVPAHTRNDFLGHLQVVPDSRVRIEGFEDYVKDKLWLIQSAAAVNITNSSHANYWDSNLYNGTNPAITNFQGGLAEYSNANFFSYSSIFTGDYETLSSDAHFFPYPKKSSTTLFEEITPNEGKRTYFYKNSGGETVNHLAVAGRLYKYLDAFPSLQRAEIKLDSKCFEDYANLLLPKAVGYSAGLLNYFFRGNIGIERDQNSPDELVVMNLSSEKMTGDFGLYYDDSNNNRAIIKTWTLDIPSYSPKYVSLSSCDLSNLSPKPEKFILAFQGTMGNEEGAVAGNANMPSLLSPCGRALTISGLDIINKNTTQQYTATGCTDCTDDVTWTATGTGASIDKKGLLTASDTACGTIRLNADCQKCSLSTSKNIKTACDSLIITGPEVIAKNSTYEYKTIGCCGNIEWFALGVGATITPDGVLTTDETLSGVITVVALCQDCETFAQKEVKTPCDPSFAITGEETIAKGSMQQYTASGCIKPVTWAYTGIGANINETGLLTTDETACGTITVKAQCPECEPPATKNVSVTCNPLTITGSDTTTKNSTKQYTAEGCCGQVQWSVSGSGASISPSGVLTTTGTSCGTITIQAKCADCNTNATKSVRVEDGGKWVYYTYTQDLQGSPSKCFVQNGCSSSSWVDMFGNYHCVVITDGYKYDIQSNCMGSSNITFPPGYSVSNAGCCPYNTVPAIRQMWTYKWQCQ